MKRIDADGHVNNKFSLGNPSVGQQGTQVDDTWPNTIQEELAGFIESRNITLDQSGVNTSQLQEAIESTIVPIGTIIPFYDYDGALTFDSNVWKYCDGSLANISGLGLQTLPDLSNRYLVGFGTDGGGDMDSAAWDTAAVGIANHNIDLQHSHGVDAHTHDVNIASFSSGSAGSHSHTVNSHSHSVSAHTHGDGSLYARVALNSGGFDGIEIRHVTVSSWTANAADDIGSSKSGGTSTQGAEVEGETASGGGGNTGNSSPGTNSTGSHTHTVNPPNTQSTSSSPGTDSQLASSQSVQPRSIRVRFIMRVL